MTTKNKIGKIVFALIGIFLTVMVIYPYALEYFLLTDRAPRDFSLKDFYFFAIGFFFFWGSRNFMKLADSLKDKFVNKK